MLNNPFSLSKYHWSSTWLWQNWGCIRRTQGGIVVQLCESNKNPKISNPFKLIIDKQFFFLSKYHCSSERLWQNWGCIRRTGRDEAQPPSMPPPNAHRSPKSRHMLDLSSLLANAMFLFLNPFLKGSYKIYIARKSHNRPAGHPRTPTKVKSGVLC